MTPPIIKLGLAEHRAHVTLELTPMQHAAAELAIKFLLARLDSNDYAELTTATVKEFAFLRTTLFGIQSMLRCAQLDADLESQQRSLREQCKRPLGSENERKKQISGSTDA